MHVAHTPRGRVNLILIDAIAAAAAVGSLPLGCPCCWSSIRLSALLVLIVCPTDCLLAQRSLNAICVAFASHQHPGSPCSPHSPPQLAGILVYDFDRFYLIFPVFFCCLFSELFSGVLLLFWSFTLLLPFQFAIKSVYGHYPKCEAGDSPVFPFACCVLVLLFFGHVID